MPLAEFVQFDGDSTQVSCRIQPGGFGVQDTCVWVTPAETMARVGVAVVPVAARHAENSEVLLFVSVAVAVMLLPPNAPTGNVAENVFVQFAALVMLIEPRQVCPSPKPLESQLSPAKNSIRKTALAAPDKYPWMVVLPTLLTALVSTG